jgi:hypothetical protein
MELQLQQIEKGRLDAENKPCDNREEDHESDAEHESTPNTENEPARPWPR